ncbi:hypothetical protein BDR04DRAFT_1103367 [Suillus decipiens]|nr:hypothetical protein BDR04DRAFT_1103367 [Suillus decipiens]
MLSYPKISSRRNIIEFVRMRALDPERPYNNSQYWLYCNRSAILIHRVYSHAQQST